MNFGKLRKVTIGALGVIAIGAIAATAMIGTNATPAAAQSANGGVTLKRCNAIVAWEAPADVAVAGYTINRTLEKSNGTTVSREWTVSADTLVKKVSIGKSSEAVIRIYANIVDNPDAQYLGRTRALCDPNPASAGPTL